LRRKIDITDEKKAISQINVIDYFKVDKNEYLIYEKGGHEENKKIIYLSKIIDNTLTTIDSDNATKLQSIVKGLLNKDKKELNKNDYKQLDVQKLAANLIENGEQKIALNEEQYNSLIVEEPKPIKKNKNLPILMILIVILLAVLAVVYLVILPKDEPKKVVENYTVRFVTGTDITLEDVIVESGGYVNLLNAIPVRSGYIFEGWYTDRNYTNAAGGSYQPTSNTLLYAKWQLKPVCDGDCAAGQLVYLSDGSAWRVVSDSRETDQTITVMSLDTIPVEMNFDNCASGVCSSEYELASIKTYLENDYLNSLVNIRTGILGVRLLTMNEFTTLEKVENASTWLYSSACTANSYWTMTPYDNEHVYLIGQDGVLEPETINLEGVEVINGAVNAPAGVRPVITVDRSLFKSSID